MRYAKVKNLVVLLSALALANMASVVRAETKVRKSAPQAAVNVGVEAAVEKLELAASASVRGPAATEEERILSEAKKIKSDLEIWPARLREKLSAVKERLESVDLEDLKAQPPVLKDFDELLDLVDGDAAAIESAWEGIRGEFTLWQQAVSRAPASYRELAGLYERKAGEEDDAVLKIQYSNLRASSLKLADRYATQATQMDAQRQEMEQKVAFVSKSRVFVKHARAFLSAVPDSQAGADVEAFAQHLRDYVQAFHDSCVLLTGLADKLAPEKTPAKSAIQPPAAAKAVPVKALTPEEYQAKLAALRRR